MLRVYIEVSLSLQESCAIAKMTARCVLYNMGALKTLP